MKSIPLFLLLLPCAWLTTDMRANNIAVSNVTVTNQNGGAQTVNVKLDLAWENSWRISTGPANWDAAWVFVKYHIGDGVWRHARLSTNNADHAVPAGVALNVGLTGTNGTGVFIYRSANGSGAVNWPGITLRWLYGQNGVSNAALVTVDVSAIEMVYVPQGSFYLGDANVAGSYNYYCSGINSNSPYFVTNAGLIVISQTPGNLWSKTILFDGLLTGVPANYPKGFNAYYCMKYEVSQGQYVDYANKTRATAFSALYTTNRQAFTGSHPYHVATTPDRAFEIPSASTVLSYLDWAGLRPLTQFEYEKACRGPTYPVPGEFAWGTALAATLPYTLANDGTPSESVASNYSEIAGNSWHALTRTTTGPARVGMFAKASYNGTTSGRIQSGASYYGIMDLSGNLNELIVRIPYYSGDSWALAYTGEHGDGAVSAGGNHDVAGFPLDISALFPVGGSYMSLQPVSIAYTGNASTNACIRGVRTAP